MTDPTIVESIITGIFGVAIAIIGLFTYRERKSREAEAAERAKREEEQRERENDKRELDECMMGMVAANSDALIVVLKHLRGEKLNGDVEKSIQTIEAECNRYSKTRDKITSHL